MKEHHYVQQLYQDTEDICRVMGGSIQSRQIKALMQTVGKKLFALENAGNTAKKATLDLHLYEINIRYHGTIREDEHFIVVAEDAEAAVKVYRDEARRKFGTYQADKLDIRPSLIKMPGYQIILKSVEGWQN